MAIADRLGMEKTDRAWKKDTGGFLPVARWLALLLALAALWAPPGLSQEKKKKGDEHIRSVQGVVTGEDGKAVAGAVVLLKNTKTLQVRSFITQENGSYYFHELSTDVDYELRAELHGAASGAKNLSAFDSRKEAIVDLKLKK